MTKRVLSVFLSLAMILSLMVIPVSAEGGVPTITLSTVSFTAEGATFTESSTINEAKPGDLIAVKVYFDNHSSNSMYIKSLDLTIEYDGNVFEPYTYSYKEGRDTITKGPVVVTDLSKFSIQSNKLNNRNAVKLSGAYANGLAIDSSSGEYHDAVLGYYMFKVISDVETNTATFKINGDDDNVKASSTQEETSTAEIEGLTFDSTASIKINGVTPEINAVNLDNANVTADGSSPVTVKATVTSKKGTDLTNAVIWSVVPENDAGVSIAPDGTITVAKDAVAGDYTITAKGKTIYGSGGNNTGAPVTGTKKELSTGSATATLKVQRNESQITSVEISDVEDVTIPADNTNNEMHPTATVKDQYGDTMSNQTVSWSLDASDVSGVSVDRSNGKVTVTNAAKDSIQSNQTFTVTATCGGKSESKTFQVKRADAVPTSITLSDVSNMLVPADEVNATANVTATVKDQYGTNISDASVAWSISPKVTGVSIDNNGKITVTNAAKEYITDTNGKQFTVTAKSGDVTKTATVTVKRADSIATSMKVFKGNAELTGNKDTIIIPSTNQDNTYTYSAKVYDQYGSKMTSAQPTMTFATADTYVTYDSNNGKVTVKQGAQKDKEYTLTVSCNGLQNKVITITAKDIEITWPTVSKKAGTYGDKWSDIVKYSGGSAMLNSTEVKGTFELKDASSVPDVGATYQFVFKSTDGTYTVESAPQTANIAQKALTITAGSASKQYDGTALTKNTVADCTVTGLVNGDVLTAVTVNGSATNVADTATGNNKVTATTIKHGDVDKTANYNITYVNGTLTITKAPLTIKANDKTITYGDAANNDGVTYNGLVNSEGGTTVAPVEYEYNYKQYDNIGEYVITPKGATEANYKITYQSGKLTVGQKEVTLTWEPTGENPVLYYDGNAKDVKATVNGTVNDDAITATVVGGKETAVGNYTAKATALTGEKAGNYALPTDVTNVTKNYQIQAALSASDLTIDPTTVTATIDGLTIKLVGYKNASETVTVKKGEVTAADNKLTVNGVTYTIDDSAVKVIDTAKIEIKTPTCTVKVPDELAAALTGFAATSDGLNNAMADLIAKAAEGMPENAKKVEVTVVLEICPTAYADGKLRLSIEPKIKYEYKDEQGATISTKEEAVKNSDIKSLITIGVKVPNGFTPNFAKHYLSGSTYEMLPVTIDSNGYTTWQQSSFSEVELVNDTRTATVTFTFGDGHAQTITYGPADIGKAFPTDSKDGYRFNGWKIGDKVYTTLTDEALTALATDATVTADFTKNNNGGNGGNSGGSGVSTYPVSVTTPKNGKVTVSPSNAAKGAAVTVTVTPDSGYEMDKLTVTDASGKTISTTDKGNGKFTFTMPNGKVSVSATFKQTTVTPPSSGFVDVPASAYYADAVKWAVEKGITTGTSATTFSPEASCTRAQMVTFLWRAAGSPAPKATTTAFTDLDKSAYYYDAVLWAVEQGITTGTSSTTFSPNATVTRGQTVTFLYRFAGQPAVSGSSSFTDVNSSDYYAAAVQWAKEQGITSGTSDTTFSPTSDCTRGQIVTFLYRQLAK